MKKKFLLLLSAFLLVLGLASVSSKTDAATIKALADVLIMQARQTRRIARQTLRLARLVTKNYSPVDVGTNI